MLETGRQADRSTGSQVGTIKIIELRHLNVEAFKIFKEMMRFMLEMGRKVDR